MHTIRYPYGQVWRLLCFSRMPQPLRFSPQLYESCKCWKRIAQEVTSSRTRFLKPLGDHYKPLKIFGPNILTSEGEEWKRYRKVVAPAFSDVSLRYHSSRWSLIYTEKTNLQRNYRMVWDETVRIVNGFFDTAWGDREVVVVDDCLADITLPVRSPMKTVHKQS